MKQIDCYWFLKEDKIKACCVDCSHKEKIQGSFWQGSVRGYGNYNLNCNFCGKQIHCLEEEIEN